MLHRVNPPSYTPLLTYVVEFEKQILRWICTPPVVFTLDVLKASLGNDDQAEWLWERIEWGSELTAFGKAVKGVVDYIHQDPSAGPRVLQCAQNDLDFQHHFTDVNYSFHERHSPADGITDADLTIFSPLLVGLYENIFNGTGFPPAIHQDLGAGNLTRAKWNENFWLKNRMIGFCPACNGQRPSIVREARASDVDHFFPKEKYPFLSIHPDNLIPTCLECNTKAHRNYDPLSDEETLPDTFHAYHCPGIEHIALNVHAQVGMGVKVTILEQNGTRSKRINNLVRVFDLETRWGDWFEGFIDSMIEALRQLSAATKADFKNQLQDELENSQRYLSTRDKCFVYASFLEYVLNNQQEFDSLCAAFGI
jgi:hypothetical protein